MHIVLLSGGSGKRLWPLSNDIRSKQFLKLFPQIDGEHLSMIQRVYRQIRQALPEAGVTIATSRTQVSTLQHQLGMDVDISVEPCRRDTFPAIVLVSAYLHDVKHVPPEAAIAVCPVDPYVEIDYFLCLKELSEKAGKANLTLMGIEPTYPSEKYGYIIPTSKDHISPVSEFKEKPTVENAKKYIASGALWNGGVFAFKLSYVLGIAQDLFDTDSYDDLLKKYDTLQKISFDYAVVEKEKSINVIRFTGSWKDLGTWNTLTESMEESVSGKVLLKMEDNITTDHIMPSNAKLLPYRSNIPHLSDFCLTPVDETFPARAKAEKGGLLVAGSNYGQGSSREHAALVPLYLGIRAVAAKSFARIHQANLINNGILPLTFVNEADYDKIDQMDELSLPEVRSAIAAGKEELELRNETKQESYRVLLPLTERQRGMILAGGLINYIRTRA